MQDFSNPSWAQVKTYLEERIASLRQRNDAVELTEVQTAAVRGEIRALKLVLDLPQRAAQEAMARASMSLEQDA